MKHLFVVHLNHNFFYRVSYLQWKILLSILCNEETFSFLKERMNREFSNKQEYTRHDTSWNNYLMSVTYYHLLRTCKLHTECSGLPSMRSEPEKISKLPSNESDLICQNSSDTKKHELNKSSTKKNRKTLESKLWNTALFKHVQLNFIYFEHIM